VLIFFLFFPPSLTLTRTVLLFQHEHGLAREEDLSSNNLMLIFLYLKYQLV